MPISLGEKLRKALLEAKPFSGICYRNVSLQYANRRDIISAQGSINAGGRFNFKGAFDVLYLSGDLHTCLEETTKSLQRPGFEVAMLLPCVVIGVKVKRNLHIFCASPSVRRVNAAAGMTAAANYCLAKFPSPAGRGKNCLFFFGR